MKKIRKMIFLLSIFCVTLIGLNVKAEVIEVTRPPKIEISDFKFEGKGNILSSTDSWKISVSLTNVIPSEVDYCKITAYSPLGMEATDDPYIFIKFYYNDATQKFEGVYNNINGLKETVYSLRAFSIFFKDGRNIRPENADSIYSLKVVVNNNCAKGTHEVYADSWEKKYYAHEDQGCPHKITQVRKCNICSQIVDTKYFESTVSNWIIKDQLNIRIKLCYQCGAIIEQQFIPKNGEIIPISSGGYKVTSVGNTVEYQGNKSKKNAIVPETVTYDGITYKVTSIAPGAFKNNKKLTKVTIGSNVKTIGKQAFYGCKNLKSITIKSKYLTTKSIGAKAFTKAGSKNYKKLVVKVPKSKKKAYVKLLKKKGLSSKAKIK